MNNQDPDIFVPPLSAFVAEKIAELIRHDIDPSLTAEELRQRGFSFWTEKVPSGHFEFTVFHRGEELSFVDFLLELAGEKVKRDFVAACRQYPQTAMAEAGR